MFQIIPSDLREIGPTPRKRKKSDLCGTSGTDHRCSSVWPNLTLSQLLVVVTPSHTCYFDAQGSGLVAQLVSLSLVNSLQLIEQQLSFLTVVGSSLTVPAGSEIFLPFSRVGPFLSRTIAPKVS